MTTQTLNQGQEAAAEGFFEFLFSDEPEMGIDGPGGVGKSHLMGSMIDDIMPRYFDTCKLMGIPPEFDGVQMCATTNKAAEIVAESTKRPSSTIHSFLNLKVKEDYSNGKSILTRTNAWKVHERKIIFVDECSMIDTPLDKATQEGLHKCKVVYVGDDRQLAPIMEPISPIYRRNMRRYTLTEPMRTKVPALQAINDQLRETVRTGVFQPIQIVPGIIDHLDDEAMQRELANHFTQQNHDKRVLSYTNNQVMLYNDYIRSLRQLPSSYTPGEFLVNNSAIQLRSRMLSVEKEVTIHSLGDPEEIRVGNDGDRDLMLTFRPATLVSSYGEVFTDIPVVEDRQYLLDLIKWYGQKKNWERYFFLKGKFPDLRQRDAATTHKSQGSTYEIVFIDLGDISTCHNADQVARMLYVAFSRAKSRVFLFGNLAQKYGGLIH